MPKPQSSVFSSYASAMPQEPPHPQTRNLKRKPSSQSVFFPREGETHIEQHGGATKKTRCGRCWGGKGGGWRRVRLEKKRGGDEGVLARLLAWLRAGVGLLGQALRARLWSYSPSTCF